MNSEQGVQKSKSRSLLLFAICYLLFAICYSTSSFAQTPEKKPPPLTRILFMFDGSQSMFGQWQSGMKIDVAKKLLISLVDSLVTVPNIEIALRCYGHQSQYISSTHRDCKDSKLEVAFYKNNFKAIKDKIQSITPKGTTPIAYSLEQTANDFPKCDDCRNIIILITDGIEECDGDPCAVSAALQKNGVVLKPFIIGFGLDSELLKTLDCVGSVYEASNESSFKNILNVVISQALNNTTAQVNLLDVSGKPTETNVNMTFYDSFSGKMKYNFIHTINNRGNPDTLVIDPLPTYKIVVHTIPPVEKDNVKLVPGKHTIIPIDAPQGDLELKVNGTSDYKSLQCIVRKQGEMQTLHIQEFNEKERYIVGKYDLEVLSLPRTYISNVVISQSHTTTVSIPQPGRANILKNSAGYGGVYLEDNNKLTLVYNFKIENIQENLVLQPGKYRAVFRGKNSKESEYTVEKPFTIISGSSEVVKLY